jgi:hypothetical protein
MVLFILTKQVPATIIAASSPDRRCLSVACTDNNSDILYVGVEVALAVLPAQETTYPLLPVPPVGLYRPAVVHGCVQPTDLC